MARSHAPTITSGRLKGRRLTVPSGLSTRPTRSLVRQALFNMLGPGVQGAVVLDLYSGSGALGLEALSRGAERVVFVERDRRALAALRENLKDCAVSPPEGRILVADALTAEALPFGPFDLILADPPFAALQGLPRDLDRPGLLSERAEMAVHLPAERALGVAPAPFEIWNDRSYGRSRLVLLRRID